MRVLLVEDDRRIASDVSRALEAAGYVVETVRDGEDAWFRGDTEDYGAIILDLGLPGMDGLAVLKRWRANGRRMPVLILTARGSWAERVDGIDAGADDYLPKPFRMEELLARLRSIVRRSAGHASSVVTAGEVTLDERQMKVSVRGVPVALSPLEYRLVAYLLHHRGRVVSQHELDENVYGHDEAHEFNAIEVLVGRVRKKLGTRPDRDPPRLRLHRSGAARMRRNSLRLRLIAGGHRRDPARADDRRRRPDPAVRASRHPHPRRRSRRPSEAVAGRHRRRSRRGAWSSRGRRSIRASPIRCRDSTGRSSDDRGQLAALALAVGHDAAAACRSACAGRSPSSRGAGPAGARLLVAERVVALAVGEQRSRCGSRSPPISRACRRPPPPSPRTSRSRSACSVWCSRSPPRSRSGSACGRSTRCAAALPISAPGAAAAAGGGAGRSAAAGRGSQCACSMPRSTRSSARAAAPPISPMASRRRLRRSRPMRRGCANAASMRSRRTSRRSATP